VELTRPENQQPSNGPRTSDSGPRTDPASPRTPDPRLRTHLFLASSNPGKLREYREAAAARGVTVEALPRFAEMTVCVEDGATFEENAHKKAIHYSREAPGWVFADDSGICVDALDGAPGVYSARFAGPQATDEQNNARLLAEIHQVEARTRHGRPEDLDGITEELTSERESNLDSPNSLANLRISNFEFRVSSASGHRAAHYICVIALAQAGRVLTVVEGRADGWIIDEPRGSRGFGYDPCFFYPPLGKTFAEMLPEEKFAVSHRGVAFRRLLDYFLSPGQ